MRWINEKENDLDRWDKPAKVLLAEGSCNEAVYGFK